MNQRHGFVLLFLGVVIGAALQNRVGENAFDTICLVGIAVYVVWTVIDYHRGDRVFIWQKRNG